MSIIFLRRMLLTLIDNLLLKNTHRSWLKKDKKTLDSSQYGNLNFE